MIRQFECGKGVLVDNQEWIIIGSYITDRVMYKIQLRGSDRTREVPESILISQGNVPPRRNVVQLSVGGAYDKEAGMPQWRYVALCDDGTMWIADDNFSWQPIQGVPQT